MGYKKHFRVRHGEHEFARGNCHINGIGVILVICQTFGHIPNGGLQSSMLFPDKRSFCTSRNMNSDFITERKIFLIEYLLY